MGGEGDASHLFIQTLSLYHEQSDRLSCLFQKFFRIIKVKSINLSKSKTIVCRDMTIQLTHSHLNRQILHTFSVMNDRFTVINKIKSPEVFVSRFAKYVIIFMKWM